MIGDELNKPQLRILLDSASLKSESAKRLLNYSDNEVLEFVSLGSSTTHTIADVSFGGEYEWYAGKITIDKSMERIRGGHKTTYGFGYRLADIRAISEDSGIKFDDLILAFLLHELIEPEVIMKPKSGRKTILVTERRKLLNRLNWGKGGFPRLPPHSILSPEEASVFIDLHCKKNDKYLIAPNYYTSKSLWYLYSLKTKLVSYQPAWSVIVFADEAMIPNRVDLEVMLDSLGNRIIDMLTAVDEIGFNYFSTVNNDTQDGMIYHFNYWVILFTGVLDSLAWISKYRYQLEFEQQERIGLRARQHRDFRELLSHANAEIDELLTQSNALINLMYGPRDLVVHRARLRGMRVTNEKETLHFNMVRISNVFFEHIVGLSGEKGERLGKWGHYGPHVFHFLEPYRFVRSATRALIDFANKYLALLDFDEYGRTNPKVKEKIQDNNKTEQHQDFLQTLELFDRFHLGY